MSIVAELKDIINQENTITVISAVGKDGVLSSEVAPKVTVWKDEQIALYQLLETAQIQKNLVYSIWFNKTVELTLITADHRNYRVIAKPYRALIVGYQFEDEYNQILKEFGENADLSTIWLLDVVSFEETSYAVQKQKEAEAHPYLMHMDHIYKQ